MYYLVKQTKPKSSRAVRKWYFLRIFEQILPIGKKIWRYLLIYNANLHKFSTKIQFRRSVNSMINCDQKRELQKILYIESEKLEIVKLPTQ